MLPYFEQPAWHVGPLTVHAFGLALAVGVWCGMAIAERRFERATLDPATGKDLAVWMLIGGILGAHLVSVLLYFPDKLRHDPWLLLRVWEDISSFGGMLGGILGGLLFFSLRRRGIGRRRIVAYFDAVAFAFPFALALGRLGCALAHDHPGTVTNFPLAISLETDAARSYIGGVYEAGGLSFPPAAATMGFHDLGFYEFLFLSAVIVPAFLYWSRHYRPPGFYLVAFCALYFPVRFGLDMLRVADVRFVGLTPAQWGAAFVLAALPFAAMPRRRLRFAVLGVVVVATACACWAG